MNNLEEWQPMAADVGAKSLHKGYRSFSRRDLEGIALRGAWEALPRCSAERTEAERRAFVLARMRGAVLDEIRATAMVDPRRGIVVEVCNPTWTDSDENNLLGVVDPHPSADLLCRVRTAVRALPSLLRAEIILRYWHGMKGSEVARMAGYGESWSSELHRRALKEMRRMIA